MGSLDTPAWLPLAAALARESSHPIARAVAHATGAVAHQDMQDVRVSLGNGITAQAGGQMLRLGRADFALENDATSRHAQGDLWLASAVGPIVAFRVNESLRPDAMHALQALRDEGIVTIMASGDTTQRAATIATELGITEWHAPCSPEDKLALLQLQRSQGHVTLAVGDGSNDAPVLAGADVSAALASGTELAQAHADFLLLHGRLQGLVDARAIACKVKEVIAQGRRWSLGYNLCAVPFAAFGLVPPWLAAIGMSVSSIVVVLNAWRIGRDDQAKPAMPA
jgi:Cu2+-exporting ATPase